VELSGDVRAERPTQSAALADAFGRTAAASAGWIVEALDESHDGQVTPGGFLDRRRDLRSGSRASHSPQMARPPGSPVHTDPQPSQIMRRARMPHE